MATMSNLLESIHQITPGERARLLGVLVRAVARDLPDRRPGMLTDDTGNPIGLFLPIVEKQPTPPEMSPADRAELQRRLNTIDQSITTEELKARIARDDVAESARS